MSSRSDASPAQRPPPSRPARRSPPRQERGSSPPTPPPGCPLVRGGSPHRPLRRRTTAPPPNPRAHPRVKGGGGGGLPRVQRCVSETRAGILHLGGVGWCGGVWGGLGRSAASRPPSPSLREGQPARPGRRGGAALPWGGTAQARRRVREANAAPARPLGRRAHAQHGPAAAAAAAAAAGLRRDCGGIACSSGTLQSRRSGRRTSCLRCSRALLRAAGECRG